METISAWATVERRVCPQSMSSCHMSEEYANSPVTFRMPSGRSVDSPMPPLVRVPWLMLVGEPVTPMAQTVSSARAAARRTASRIFS